MMSYSVRKLFLPILILLISSCQDTEEKETLELWYDKPASQWEEALPIGNGRLGTMIYGIPSTEHIQFNEETLWDGAPRQYQHEGAHKYLPEIRSLLYEGKQDEAEKLAGEAFMGRLAYEDEFPTKKARWADSILHLNNVTEAIKPEFADKEWPVMFMDYKSVWERKGLPDMNGSVLFRKKIDIPKNWAGKDLVVNFGRIKDQDFSYFNGELIGSMDESNTNRTYTIPAKLVKPGKNVFAVLINNYVSTGGFNAVRTGPQKMYVTPAGSKGELIFIEGDWRYKVLDTDPPFYPQYQAAYQPFGDIEIKFEGHENVSEYRRSLDLSKALAKVRYLADGVQYKREYLASHPDNIIAMRFTADQNSMISFKANFKTEHPIHTISKIDDNTISLSLKVEDGKMKGVSYLNIKTDGGKVNVDSSGIEVTKANRVILKLIAATNYKSYKSLSANPNKICQKQLNNIRDLGYSKIRKNHIEDYQSLYNRFYINLGDEMERVEPTDKRIFNVKKEKDDDLAAMYVQYARYLMISSGREGTNPPNLQGIWNDKIYPAWGSKYTTNINCEMNFWPVEPLNLQECHSSLFKLIDEVAEEGTKTARIHYDADGSVLHHNTDQWRGTAPINNPNHGIWVTGGAWLSHHLWEHFLYSRDTTFLRNKAYPILKSSAEFFMDFLIEDQVSGFLVSGPSNSPEHGGLVIGPAMAHQIIRSLFKIIIQSSEILDSDREFALEVKNKLERVAPDKIGRYGQLQEWIIDIDDTTSRHRHVSHLWAVHPGAEITVDNDPELIEAAKQSLIYRGDEGTGWSLAWKINFWARFMDGDHAHKMIRRLLSPANDPDSESSAGSYPNLFDAHPPFQIDGNFGGAAGIVEMIVQSHQGYIHLFPALPKAWPNGEIRGLRCRGGFEMDLKWTDYQPEYIKIKSHAGGILGIKFKDQWHEQETEASEEYDIEAFGI